MYMNENKRCYSKICEKCVYKGAVNKRFFGKRFTCTKNCKPENNKCYYFACEGRDSHMCV